MISDLMLVCAILSTGGGVIRNMRGGERQALPSDLSQARHYFKHSGQTMGIHLALKVAAIRKSEISIQVLPPM